MTLVTAHFVTSHRGCGGGRETMNFILHMRYVNTCVGADCGGTETINFILHTRYVSTCVGVGCGGSGNNEKKKSYPMWRMLLYYGVKRASCYKYGRFRH
jgi:hypothetical protein